MLSKSDVENNLSLVAKGKLDLWAFQEWVEDNSWNMHKDSPEDAIELVEDIKLAFEEYYQGRKDERALLTCLAGIPIVYVSALGRQAETKDVLPYFMLLGQRQELAVA